MKHQLTALFTEALARLKADGVVPPEADPELQVARPKERSHGDYACNLAMQLATPAQRNPRELAQAVVERLPASDLVERVEIAGPGFINVFLSQGAHLAVIGRILEQHSAYGRSNLGEGRSVQVEFVSANPTGPLHVGHGRGAAYGAAVADLLEAVGFQVHREYYVNDGGRQMDILAASVWLRYLELCGVQVPFPANAYRGDYVRGIARVLYDEHGDSYAHGTDAVTADLPPDEAEGGDKEAHIDAVIRRTQALLGDNRYRYVFELALNSILDDIREDLREFGVVYDQWYSERSLTDSGAVNQVIDRLQDAGHVYEHDGALWFRSSSFDDAKDRVVRRDNGQSTYFASDIAYHLDKMERGFDRVVDVWGADHHGYVPRVRAALRALGQDVSRLHVLLVQFAILYRSGEKVPMSTRAGEFVTLRQLREEVGSDAARFFYVMRKCEQHLDFDLDLAKSESADNPVYYIQYAHARITSVMRQLEEKGLERDPERGSRELHRLTEAHEQALINDLGRYPEVVEAAALAEEPHQVAHYLRDLANSLHTYYNAHQFLVGEPGLRDARLNLILATRQVLRNGLHLLGVSAPEAM